MEEWWLLSKEWAQENDWKYLKKLELISNTSKFSQLYYHLIYICTKFEAVDQESNLN